MTQSNPEIPDPTRFFSSLLGYHWRKDANLMKRANVSSRESKVRPPALTIRCRINDGNPQPVRVLKRQQAPEVGQSFQGVPERFGRKNTLQRTLRVLNITEEDGIKIFHCTTAPVVREQEGEVTYESRAEEIRTLIKMNMAKLAAERTTILFDGLITDLIRMSAGIVIERRKS
jgi:hypothetical protein